jgi:hypothetical protein
MKNRINKLLATFLAVLVWSSSAYAGCTNAQFAGTWDVVFTDGNSCKVVVDRTGEVLIAGDRTQSVCFDPFRGVTEPDSGTVSVGSDCLANISLVVEGVTVEMLGRIASPRNIGAGGFLIFVHHDTRGVVYSTTGNVVTNGKSLRCRLFSLYDVHSRAKKTNQQRL